jgi:DNA-directed RNA polymerase
MSIYKTFLDDLTNQKQAKTHRSHLLTYNDIDNASSFEVPDHLKKEVSWSSQYDPAKRSPFAKDITHLQSLMDALLAGKNFDRANKILSAIYPILPKPEDFIFSVNKYLEVWALDESVSLNEVEGFVEGLQRKFDGVMPNYRTRAILLAKYIQTKTDYSQFLQENKSKCRQIFSNIDIIGVDSLITVFQNDYITEKEVPKDLLHLYEQVRSESEQSSKSDTPEYFQNPSSNAPIIDKDMESLKPVNSFSLTVIRHTLLGLKAETGSEEFQKLINDIETDSDCHILHNNEDNSKRDYFEIYKSLKTDKQRQRFSEALDLFNESRQRELELRGVDGAKEKWKHEFDEMQKRGGIKLDKGLNAQLFKWYRDVLPYVEKEAELCDKLLKGEVSTTGLSPDEQDQMKKREIYAPYFILVPPKKICVIMILELLKLNSSGGVSDGMRIARALVSVGRAIEMEFRSQSLVKSDEKVYSKKVKTTKQWKKLLRRKNTGGTDQSIDDTEWSSPVLIHLGSTLISLLLHVAKVPVTGSDPTTGKVVKGLQPAFHHTFQYLNGQKIGVIKIHKEVIRQLAGNSFSNCVQPQLLPMLIPPRPWTSYKDGGFLYTQNSVIRIKDSAETMAYLKAASDFKNLDDIYAGLNVLGNTAWTINRKVFEVITHYWNTGEKVLGIPPMLEEPELPPKLPLNAEPTEKLEYNRHVRQIINEAATNRSQRCDTNYKLEIARAFVGEKIYFPHNIDFRGRAYPISPHLNHLGNDLTRSLFLFWEGRELGEKGLGWLKVQLANVYGIDKAPLHERKQFVEENLDNVFASAKDPFVENAWWKKAEKPWQALSVCYELYEAYKLEDPTKYVSHLPVHQDGTCNGLQHYAALGGDIEGAKQVNLIPADRPQDVYSYVASLVQKRVDAEAAEGNQYALFLQDKITRKVVKQTVMTNVYGVTFVGGLAQIKKQITQHFDKEEDPQEYARYLTVKVFASVRELFEGAHLIQDWLGESAKRISKSISIDYEDETPTKSTKPNHMSSVIWTTPIGLPCVQPYRTTKVKLIKTNLQDISITDPFGASQVDARKQQAAFPPNFVHSLDATHMLMTAKSCGKANLSFAAVHDSYWTHASDVDFMNQEIRNQFVNLHKNNLVQQLREEFEKRYKRCVQVLSIPRDHELAIKIKELRKNFAQMLGRPLTVADEIYSERTRLQLLESDDPLVVQKGRELVTTVSLTEGYDIDKIAMGSGSVKGYQILAPLKFPEVPKRGDLDVDIVKDSAYFFS